MSSLLIWRESTKLWQLAQNSKPKDLEKLFVKNLHSVNISRIIALKL